jgi:hypothetical protein
MQAFSFSPFDEPWPVEGEDAGLRVANPEYAEQFA